MRRIICVALGLWLGLAGYASAQQSPVVVELYTSQGCSSCPPADAIFAELAPRDDVIALALHVDYWDYIGWKDHFADPAYTKRQRGYAQAAGHRTIYTPQMIVQGRDHLVGARPLELAELILAHAGQPAPVRIRLEPEGDRRMRLVAVAEPPLGREVIVQLVRYLPEQTVSIERGENAGHTLSYVNIVTHWERIARWDGTAPLEMEADRTPGQGSVVIVQEAGQGPILAAARLR